MNEGKNSHPNSIQEGITAFKQRWYADISDAEWNSWQWQMGHAITTLKDLGGMLGFSVLDLERAGIEKSWRMPLRLTPYYAALIHSSESPLSRTVLPDKNEAIIKDGEYNDPLGEDHRRPVPGIIHTYPDKVVFLATTACASYCRYCTRSRRAESLPDRHVDREWDQAVSYIQSHPAVRDVLISGGDPLILSDEELENLLGHLSAIEHVEIIRIGTKVPAVLPQRITPALVEMLKKYHPLWMSLHFTHPDELTVETQRAVELLADGGIPLTSQTVLLKAVNDDLEVIKALFLGLLRLRVKPYYLHQCDAAAGTSHFRTPLEKGKELIRGLHGHTSGYAVPHFMIDAPGGGGKIPVAPDYVQGRDGDRWLLENYKGDMYEYCE